MKLLFSRYQMVQGLAILSLFVYSIKGNCGPLSNLPTQRLEKLDNDSTDLISRLHHFLQDVDSGRVSDVIACYDSNLLSVRVVDEGQFVKMDYRQMVGFWKAIAARQKSANGISQAAIITQKTTIHFVEINGTAARILMTRVKDLGSGPEPLFYDLSWIQRDNRWYLFREIVHQRTAPKIH